MVRAYISSGGGVRIGATWGAQLIGEEYSGFHYSMFDTYIGTSAGALDAALTANRWSARKKADLFLNTNFEKFFTSFFMPFAARKLLAATFPISLAKLSEWIESLGLVPVNGLLINTVNSSTNEHIVYCEDPPLWWNDSKGIQLETKAFSRLGFGDVITRSMALPGLNADEPEYRDGGYAENPLMSVLPDDTKGLMINLGYAGTATWHGGKDYPIAALDQAMYYVEYKNYYTTQQLIKRFKNLKVINPEVYDINPTDFGISSDDKKKMLVRAQLNTRNQW